MTEISISLRPILSRTKVAVDYLDNVLPRNVKGILDARAAQERAEHRYTNRTGNAEASTFAGPIERNGRGFSVTLGVRVHYASYLADRDFSSIRSLAVAAERDVYEDLLANARRIAGIG